MVPIQATAKALFFHFLGLESDQTESRSVIAHVALSELAYLSAETDHGKHICLCHLCSEFPIENLDGPMMDIILRRDSTQISDGK
jgi:hypothetical protein